jgi:hypothetical protein
VCAADACSTIDTSTTADARSTTDTIELVNLW